MKKLNITKGNWFLKQHSQYANGRELFMNEKVAFTLYNQNATEQEHIGNCILIENAGTAYNQCGLLPSELLAQRNQLLAALKRADLRIQFLDQYTEGKLDPSTSDYIVEAITNAERSNNEN